MKQKRKISVPFYFNINLENVEMPETENGFIYNIAKLISYSFHMTVYNGGLCKMITNGRGEHNNPNWDIRTLVAKI